MMETASTLCATCSPRPGRGGAQEHGEQERDDPAQDAREGVAVQARCAGAGCPPGARRWGPPRWRGRPGPARVRYSSRKKADTATIPTARDHDLPGEDADQPDAAGAALLAESASGKAMGRPLLKVWDSTSVMIMPMPMESTMVLLMSTSPRFCHHLLEQRRGDEVEQRSEEAIAGERPRGARLFPVSLQHHPGDVHGEDDHLRVGEVDDHGHQEQEVEPGDQEHVDAPERESVDDLGDEDLHASCPQVRFPDARVVQQLLGGAA